MTRRTRSTARPVAGTRRPPRSTPLFRHIMVPVDLSDRNERALGAARGLARERGGRVTLFHVIQRVSGIASGEFDAFYRRLVERSERKLQQIARKFAEGGFDVRTAVRVGEPAAEILRATLRERVDLVVMGSPQGQAGWPAARVGHHELQGGDLVPVPDPTCQVKPTATHQRSPGGAAWAAKCQGLG
jgi:nucleotide-binding universal stress UspA family protein